MVQLQDADISLFKSLLIFVVFGGIKVKRGSVFLSQIELDVQALDLACKVELYLCLLTLPLVAIW
jgi:hypothetical protein